MTRLMLIVCLAATACGGSRGRVPSSLPGSPPSSESDGAPSWTTGEMPDLYDASTHLMVVGRGPNPEAAEADAKDKMTDTVLGPEQVRPFSVVPDELQDFAYTPATERYQEPGGDAFVRLIAQKVFVMDRLKAWEALMGVGALPDEVPEAFRAEGAPVTDPSAHLDALATTLAYQRASAFVCARGMAVTTSTCTPTNLGAIRSAVSTFGQALALRPRFAGRVPYRAGVGAQAPVKVQVVWTPPGQGPIPVSGVPLVFKGTDTATAAKQESDDRGLAEWLSSPSSASQSVQIGFDAGILLGQDASLWAALPTAKVGYRAVTANSARIAWMVKESGRGHSGRDGFVKKADALGLQSPSEMPSDLKTRVPESEDMLTAEALRAVAEAANGAIDFVAVGEMHSQFAGKLGARSVWHEARGTLHLYDLWTGARLGPIKGAARASAIGERAASAKARRRLGERWATNASQLLNQHFQTGASARR